METNHSINHVSGMRKSTCETGNSLHLLRRNEKLYLSLSITVQAVLTVFINTLVLVVIRRTKQQKNRYLKTVRLLSIHDIAAALLGKSAFLVLLNYDIKSCKIATSLSSVVVFVYHLNTGIITFISFDRLLQVKLANRYQLRSNNKASNIILMTVVLLPVLWIIQANVNSFTPIPSVITLIFVSINIIIVVFGVTCNLATSIILRRHKKQVRSMVSCISQRTLRLTQLFIICFVVFKIPLIAPIVMWVNTESNKTATALLYTVINIISNLDAVINSFIFFFMNRGARCYLKEISSRVMFGTMMGLRSKLRKASNNKNERNNPTCETKGVNM